MKKRGIMIIKKVVKGEEKSALIKQRAFTLAEMMVVLLILSIIMAAFAPVMTTRSKTNQNSPWKYATNGSDAYYGTGATQTAMIGQPKAGDTDNAKLLINVTDTLNTRSHIILKRNGNILGRIFIKENNLIFGNNMQDLTGDYNTIIGKDALTNMKGGSKNTAVGFGALKESIDNQDNTAIGYNALNKLGSSGSGISINRGNVAVGVNAMASTSGAESNVAIGDNAMANAVGGNANVAIGANALIKSQSNLGSKNIAIGDRAMSDTTASGDENIALGSLAMSKNTGGKLNIAMGTSSLQRSSGMQNIAIGNAAMSTNTVTGSNNVAIGNSSLGSVTAGSNNIALGQSSLTNNTSGGNNVAIGNQAMSSGEVTSSNNVAIGTYALTRSTTGSANVSIGNYTMSTGVVTGGNNIAIGNAALMQNSSGNWNTALGTNALTANTTGKHNVAMGYYALYNNITGENNTAIGYNACRYVTGSNKTCIGKDSGPKKSSYANNSDYKGDNEERIFIGGTSKFNGADAVLEVHNLPGSSRDDVASTTVLGTNGTSVVINGNLIVKGNTFMNSSYVGDRGRIRSGIIEYVGTSRTGQWNGDTAGFYPGIWKNYADSDARLKYIGKENTSGLDKIKELKVFNYTFKSDEKKTPRVGIIAQDLQKIFPDAVTKGEGGYLQIRMEDMFYALVNAVKELDVKIANLINKNKTHDDEIKALKEQNEKLIQQNKALEARLLKLEQKLK